VLHRLGDDRVPSVVVEGLEWDLHINGTPLAEAGRYLFEEFAWRGHVLEHMAEDGGVERQPVRECLEAIGQLPHAWPSVIHTVHQKALEVPIHERSH
jgi:hypothetical protein